MAADPYILRQAWVDITSTSYHGLPEEVHHVATRGAHPESALDPANLRGLPGRLHRRHHDGAELPTPVDLADVWG